MRHVVSLFAALFLLGCSHGSAQRTVAPPTPVAAQPAAAEGHKLAAEADRLLGSGDPIAALGLYRRAWELGVRESAALYNAACAASLAGQTVEGLSWLERAVDAGFTHAAHLEADPDLAALRAEAGFAPLAARVAASEAKLLAAAEPALRDELLRRMAEDQAAREAVERSDFQDAAALARMKEVEAANTARMKALVAEGGWPTRSRVGARGAEAAWLLVQHADADLAFQKHCLALLARAASAGEASLRSLAHLTDRVLVAEGKPQRYGTQFHRPEGAPVPRPMEAPEGVDARRAAMGLEPLADQVRQLEQLAIEVQ